LVTATFSATCPSCRPWRFVGSAITLACLIVTDICYAIADPRVSYD